MHTKIQVTLFKKAPIITFRQLGFKPYVYPYLSDLPLYVLIENNDDPVFVLIDEDEVMYEYVNRSELLVMAYEIKKTEFVFNQFIERGIIYRVAFPVDKKQARKRRKKSQSSFFGQKKMILASHQIVDSAAQWFMRVSRHPNANRRMLEECYPFSKSPRQKKFSDSIGKLSRAFNDIKSYGGYQEAMRILEQNMDRTDWTKIDYDLVDAIDIYEACIYCN